VDLLVIAAVSHSATHFVVPTADTELKRLEVLEEATRVGHVVAFEPDPERGYVVWARLVGGCDEALHAIRREVVVRQMNLFDPGVLRAEIGQAFRTSIVKVVLVELQDPKLGAAAAEVNHDG
jgi:hypothetical protein